MVPLVLAAIRSRQAELPDDADAQASQRSDTAEVVHSETLQEAVVRFADSRGDPMDLLLMERAVTIALARLDLIGPRPCYQEWWSTIRAAYTMFAEGIRGLHTDDPALMQAGFMGADLLGRMATRLRPTVTCT
jgi:hypothetical protein